MLWGDYTFSPKDKRVVKLKRSGSDSKAKPMFVQFILDAIWKVRSGRSVCWIHLPGVGCCWSAYSAMLFLCSSAAGVYVLCRGEGGVVGLAGCWGRG